MRRVLMIGLVFGVLILTSCKKEYTCDYTNNESSKYSNKDYSDSQIEAAKNTCEKAGGKWAQK